MKEKRGRRRRRRRKARKNNKVFHNQFYSKIIRLFVRRVLNSNNEKKKKKWKFDSFVTIRVGRVEYALCDVHTRFVARCTVNSLYIYERNTRNKRTNERTKRTHTQTVFSERRDLNTLNLPRRAYTPQCIAKHSAQHTYIHTPMHADAPTDESEFRITEEHRTHSLGGNKFEYV